MEAFAPAMAGVVWVHVAAVEMAAGALVFLALVVRPLCAGAPHLWAWIETDSRKIAKVVVAAAAITLLAWLWLAVRAVVDDPAQVDPRLIFAFISRTLFGQLWLLRMVLVVFAGVPLLPCIAARLYLGRFHLVTCLLLLVSLAFTSHVAASQGAAGVLVQAIHLAATAAWVGSLPALAFLLYRADRTGGAWADLAARVVRSYAVYGTVAVVVLMGSGVVVAAILLDGKLSWADGYSRTLIVKIALFALMGMVGLGNRVFLAGRIFRREAQAFRAMQATTLVELASAAAILFAAAVLAQTSPP